jgi:hypothetical protein
VAMLPSSVVGSSSAAAGTGGSPRRVQWDVALKPPAVPPATTRSSFPRHLEQSDEARPFPAAEPAPASQKPVLPTLTVAAPSQAVISSSAAGPTSPRSTSLSPRNSSLSPRESTVTTDMLGSFEARIAKYEADAAALRAELAGEREKVRSMAAELGECVPRSQHRSAIVALEVRLAAHDLTSAREVQGLKTALAAAASARVAALDADWTRRWEAREAQFKKQWEAREEAYHKESASSLERIQDALEAQYGASLTDLTRQLSSRPSISREVSAVHICAPCWSRMQERYCPSHGIPTPIHPLLQWFPLAGLVSRQGLLTGEPCCRQCCKGHASENKSDCSSRH